MACISYNKAWEWEFDNIVAEKHKMQGLNVNEVKLKVRDIFKKVEKVKTNFESFDDKDMMNKSKRKIKKKTEGHLSILEKDYNEFILQYNKQSVEEL